MPIFPLLLLVGGIAFTVVVTVILLMAERRSRDE